MTTTLNGIPNCDTVKKARKWLEAQGIEHSFRDFKKDPPSADEVGGWADAAGWEVLLNKRGRRFASWTRATRPISGKRRRLP